MRKSTQPIQSLDRGLRILAAVSDSTEPVSLTVLAEQLDLDPSTTYRLANTLRLRGFLTQSPATKAYSLGPTIWQLANRMRENTPLLQVAREHIDAVAEQTGETTHLAIRHEARVLFLDQRLTNHAVGVATGASRSEPLHCTALGKALIVDFGGDELKDLFGQSRLPRETDKTIRTTADLAAECARVRSQGYATDDEEYRQGVRCVAAPIRNFYGEVVAAIGVSAPASRLPKRRFAEVGAVAKAAAGHIAARLGYVGP